VVTENTVIGEGSYAIQIHGGHGNTIRANRFDVTGDFLLYQSNYKDGYRAMDDNIIDNNASNTFSVKIRGQPSAPPLIRRGRMRPSGWLRG
jgi:hypothetical protein